MNAKFDVEKISKLEVAQQVIVTALLPRLKTGDRLSIITFSDKPSVKLPLTDFANVAMPKLKADIVASKCDGGTDLTNGNQTN